MSRDYKALAEHLREQRIKGAPQGRQVAVRQNAPQKREISDKSANLIATALKDFLR